MSELSQALLLSGLEELATGIILFGPDERILLWNRRMAQSSGITPGHAGGRTFAEVFPELAGGRVHNAVRTSLQRGLPAILSQTLNATLFPLTVPGSDAGHPMQQQVQIIPLRDDGGTRYSLVQVFDITAMFNRERYIKAREQEFRALFELAASGNARIDFHGGRFLRANRKLCELTGYTEEELKQLELSALLPDAEAQAEVAQALARIERNEAREYTAEVRFKNKEGAILWSYLCIAAGNQGKKLETARPILVLLDITERKLYEEALQRAKEAAEANNRAKSVFLSNMSHELRTPLNAVLGFAQLMARDPSLPENHQRNLATIDRSGQHLLQLINDVLEISRIESGKLRLECGTFNLLELLLSLEDMFRIRAKAKGLELHVEIEGDIGIWKNADGHHLTEVLINLLGNAVKYTEAGGLLLRVTALPDSRLRFEVIDSGPGIPAADKKRLFDPFFQTSIGVAKGEGTGLGLAISNEYVGLMGGCLKIEDVPEGGSNFYFEIELPSAARPEQANLLEQQVAGLADGQKPPRILVAEDDVDSRALVVELLRGTGFEVREAVDGREAIETFTQWQPHFIWMDMRMPGLDGFEATRRIRALEGGKEVVIVALTASAFREDREIILKAGCDSVIHKPVRTHDIFAALEKYLGVRYRYAANGSAHSASFNGLDKAALRSQLQTLPWDLSARLRIEALNCNMHEIELLIEEIRRLQPVLGDTLMALATCFDYDRIVKILDEHFKPPA